MSIEIGDSVVDERALPGRQGRLAFACLLVERRRPVPRDELADLLWAGTPPASWEKGLAVVISKLRAVLAEAGLRGPELLTNAFGCYQLHLPEDTWVDIEAAETAVDRAEKALAEGDVSEVRSWASVSAAIARRGFLPGEEGLWVESRRAELGVVLRRALDCTAEAALRQGDTAAAVAAAAEAVAAEPYREQAYLQMIRAQSEAGDRAEALRTYERCRRLLAEDLGVNPSPQTEAAYLLLLGTEPARPLSVLLSLPSPLAAKGRFAVRGRGEEMGRLDSSWAAVPDGERRVVTVVGEAGAGKTRLAAEFAHRVHAQGALVLYGRCEESLDAAYQPFCEALGRYCVDTPIEELRTHSPRQLAELSRLVPELRERVVELAEPTATETESDRFRLFDAVTSLMTHMSRRAPVLWILDDLHWADTGTLLLLRHLCRHADQAAVLIVATMRNDDLEADGQRAGLVADLLRETERLVLSGLTEADVTTLASDALGRVLTQEERDGARRLWAQTAGNPFFVTEVLADGTSLSEGIGSTGSDDWLPVPEGVRAVIERRLAALSPPARRVLQVAAVAGPTFEVGLLERLPRSTIGDTDVLLDAIDELSHSRAVVEFAGDPGRYRFSHDLIRAVVYDQLSGMRRARHHLAFGLALETVAGQAPPEQLVRHFVAAIPAGGAAKAVDCLAAAGKRALSVFAYEQAAAHLHQALEILDGAASDDSIRRCQLNIDLGRALVCCGDAVRAIQRFAIAVELARTTESAPQFAQAVLGAVGDVADSGADAGKVALLKEAAGWVGDQDTSLAIRLKSRLAMELYVSRQLDERESLGIEALTAARTLGDPATLGTALSASHHVLFGPHNLAERLAVAAELRDLAAEVDDRELAMQAHWWHTVDLLELGDIDGVDQELDTWDREAQNLCQPRYRWAPAMFRAARANLAGEIGRCEELATAAYAIGAAAVPDNARTYFLAQYFSVRRWQGLLADLEPTLISVVNTTPAIPLWRCALAYLYAEVDRPDEARQHFRQMAATGFDQLPFDSGWLMAISLLGDVCGYLADRDQAAVLYELMLPYADRNIVAGFGAVSHASAARCLGVLCGTMSRFAEAEQHFATALAANDHLGARAWNAHTQMDYADMLVARSDRKGHDQARRLLADAAASFDRLELTHFAERAQSRLSAI